MLDVNEAPVSTDFLQDGGQLTFAKVRERIDHMMESSAYSRLQTPDYSM